MNKKYALFLLATVFFALGSYLFGYGNHNIDLAWNLVNCPSCFDINYYGTVQTPEQLYLSGSAILFQSWFFLLIGFLLLLIVVLDDI